MRVFWLGRPLLLGGALCAFIASSPQAVEARQGAPQEARACGEAPPPTLEVIPDSSYLVVITRRAGAAARLAHDHLIAAQGWELELELPADHDSGAVSFHLAVPADSLLVDDPHLKRLLEDRLEALGIMPGAFSTTSADDRREIREAMLAEDQLNAPAHPRVEARLISARRDSQVGEFPYVLEVELAAAGGAAVGEMRGRVVEADDRIRVEAYGPMHFSHLGIEPYSAFWGMVRNQDRFYLYLSLAATRTP